MNNKNKIIIELGFQVIAKNYADLGGRHLPGFCSHRIILFDLAAELFTSYSASFNNCNCNCYFILFFYEWSESF